MSQPTQSKLVVCSTLVPLLIKTVAMRILITGTPPTPKPVLMLILMQKFYRIMAGKVKSFTLTKRTGRND